jgi:hypothetical protein
MLHRGKERPVSTFGYVFLMQEFCNTTQDDLPTYTQGFAVCWYSGCLFVWIFGWLVGWFNSSFDSEVEAAISSETLVPSDKSHVVIHQKALSIDNSRPQPHYT